MESVRLRDMTNNEYDTFYEKSIVDYAEANVVSGRWSAEEAQKAAREQFEVLLPEGLMTPANLLKMAEKADGTVVGYVWINLDYRPGTNSGAYIYDIEIHEEFRGQGLGRALLQAAEETARDHGVLKMGLNVFGQNAVARKLYESSGYETVAIQMKKTL